MKTPTSFLEQLVETVESLDTVEVKNRIGDSTNNHRVLTVVQLIRFLNTRRNPNTRKFAAIVSEVYASVREDIFANRAYNGLSTDYTVYVTEFINFLENSDTGVNNSVRAAIKRAA